MKLHYSPSYSGFVYSDTTKVMFNEKVVNTTGLVEFIKLHAGIYSEKKDAFERFLSYYKAMKQYMQNNPSCILKRSFDIDGLNVAKECLSWRDALCFAGWNKTVKSSSQRILVLQGIEEYFQESSPGEELISVIEAVNSNCTLLADLQIITPIDYKLFSPLEVELIEALKKRGVSVSTMEYPKHKDNALSEVIKNLESSSQDKVQIKKDNSFQILSFEEQKDSYKYLSLKEENSYDVWINSDNKALDNWLYLEGKPTSGSVIKGGLPQTTQMLSIGLSMLKSPMDIKNLVEWLNVSSSPVPSKLRAALIEKIVRKGGYYNDDCKKVIEDYVGLKNKSYNDEEETKDLKKEESKREELVRKFLPDINNPDDSWNDTIDVNSIRTFAESLLNWCGSKISCSNDDTEKTQLGIVKRECAAVLDILGSEKEKRISYNDLIFFVLSLKSSTADMLQYEAECGCRTIVSGPGEINSPCKNLIWCDFYNEPGETLKYDFLTPTEKEEFKKTLKLWDEDKEKEYNSKIKLIPFKFAENVTLVVINKLLGDDIEKHSFFIQLEKRIENFHEFVNSPCIEKDFKHLLKDVTVVDNRVEERSNGIKIKNASMIKWPKKEFYTSLDQLLLNPFDYAFYYLAKIKSLGNNSIPKESTTHGNVAHAVIEKLFNKLDDVPGSGTVPYIKKNIEENFEIVFKESVNACGAILLLKENILRLENYKSKVKRVVNELVKVLEDNKLSVVKCEPSLVAKQVNFAHNIEIGGDIDMVLEDKDGNIVVFDFKWYPQREKKFKDIIKENKSIQLELYKYLTESLTSKKAKKVAYVVLPEVTLVSSESFVSSRAIKVEKGNEDELLSKIRNSYKYRRNEISTGFIEEATGLSPEEIQYEKDREEMNLYPLEFNSVRKPEKKAKEYPLYEFFKSRRKEEDAK